MSVRRGGDGGSLVRGGRLKRCDRRFRTGQTEKKISHSIRHIVMTSDLVREALLGVYDDSWSSSLVRWEAVSWEAVSLAGTLWSFS